MDRQIETWCWLASLAAASGFKRARRHYMDAAALALHARGRLEEGGRYWERLDELR